MTASVAFSIRRASPADRAAVLALVAATLGWRETRRGGTDRTRGGAGVDPLSEQGLAEFFEWKHERNPFGVSPAWVALDNEQVVGFRTFLRWEFETAGGGTRRAVRAVDTATHPEYRGRGVFRALTLAAVDALAAEGVDFVFNTPNDKSRPGYLSMGWEEVGRLPTAVRVARPAGAIRMLRSRVPADRWPLPGGPGAAAPDALADDRVATLLERLGPPAGLRTRRTVAHLRWRYGYAPLGYRAIAAGGDPSAGIVVFRLRARGTAKEAALCELLVPPGAGTTAATLCREVARTSGADYVIRLGGPAPRAGFLPLARQGPVLTWRALASRAPAPPRSGWQLALGDVELL